MVTVTTCSQTVAMRPRISGVTMMQHLLPAAVSGWPPGAPRSTPSEPVSTLTLKSVSTSRAARTTKSSLLTKAPLLAGLAYWEADISKWLGVWLMEFTASRSKSCTSMTLPTLPFFSSSTMGPQIPPMAQPILMPRSSMYFSRNRLAAREGPPTPVWKEKPSLK